MPATRSRLFTACSPKVAPSHAPLFLVEVRLGERSLAQGQGRTKKQAEQMAAREALETLLKPARDEES